ncbi:putative beta-lysine N-acetyltransferase [Bacillus sp. HMF5848]|uniref:putative beta-lysine N-acetyltransferase n=1 Tax=Bacillus sp. HMF5848 TaxID=2495421 RepID=UPI000F79F2C5|nr:putative beta-lysine N-acetyltransferase [Bacillus sp. HMF5848]RSK23932.1 putative beta-lysine N-acetyltransferase [Bacillus sp. HMF5848]RSK28747.1 putative beta-lysine N-acetyltransferase [Bacillus sp. HMF5848]
MTPPYETKKFKTSQYEVQLFLDYFNERLRVDDYRGNVQDIVKTLDPILSQHNFKKLIFFARSEHFHTLLSLQFELEAIIYGFFNGSDNYIMTRFADDARRTSSQWVKEDGILEAVRSARPSAASDIPKKYVFRKATKVDAHALSELYGKVFAVYPTPVTEAAYVKKMIEGGTVFYVVECGGQLVSAASADINETLHHAELTDCATLYEHRKYGLIKQLLKQLEDELKQRGIYCAFSIARALSYGMNAALHQLGYCYTGRLTNNCYIFDKLEDMNVWVKDLSR